MIVPFRNVAISTWITVVCIHYVYSAERKDYVQNVTFFQHKYREFVQMTSFTILICAALHKRNLRKYKTFRNELIEKLRN